MEPHQQEHWNETYRSLVTISLAAFKYLALVNGGAMVALLAYIGNVVAKDIATPNMMQPMFLFVMGLALCGLGMICAYLTQLQLLQEMRTTGTKERHRLWLWSAIASAFLSLALFAAGSITAVIEFSGFTAKAVSSPTAKASDRISMSLFVRVAPPRACREFPRRGVQKCARKNEFQTGTS